MYSDRDSIPDHEQKQVALGYVHEAWAEARLDGVDGDCMAQACLFAALIEFVSTYGEDAKLWQRRWRLFFLATAGLFGHGDSTEWGVSHYLLKPAR